MTTEVYWLAMTCLLTSVMWVPYILNRVMVRGLPRAMGNPIPEDKPHAGWAERAIKAHTNTVENLVVFAPAVLMVHVLGAGTAATATAAMVFFFLRLAHYVVYVAGVPYVRTLLFAAGWVAQIVILLAVLQFNG